MKLYDFGLLIFIFVVATTAAIVVDHKKMQDLPVNAGTK